MARRKKESVFFITDEAANKIIKNAMEAGWLLWIKTSAWGNRKMLSKELLEEKFKEDAEAIGAVQKLLDNDEVRKVIAPMSRAQNKARNVALPWFHDGVYFIHEKDVEETEKFLVQCRNEMRAALDEFKAKYDSLKKAQKKKHPKLYNEAFYPPVESFDYRFRIRWGWQRITLPVGDGKTGIGVMSKEMLSLIHI